MGETFELDAGETAMRRDDFTKAVVYDQYAAEPHLPVVVNWNGRTLAVRSVTVTNEELSIDVYDPAEDHD